MVLSINSNYAINFYNKLLYNNMKLYYEISINCN